MRRWCEGGGMVLTQMLYGGEKVFLLPLTRRLNYRLPKGREQVAGKLDRGSALDMVVDILETDKKYGVIYADPPWTYKTYSGKGKEKRSAENHYACMRKEDIQALPVQGIAAEDCVLFLWVTMPCLEEGLELIRKWGFTYKTCAFTWVKQNRKSDGLFWGLGFWTRANAELCLLATRGNPKRVSKGVHSVVLSHVREHSRKPDEVRDRIVELMGDIPRIELFARQQVDGWDCWGDEV